MRGGWYLGWVDAALLTGIAIGGGMWAAWFLSEVVQALMRYAR